MHLLDCCLLRMINESKRYYSNDCAFHGADLMRKNNGRLKFTLEEILANVRGGSPEDPYGYAVTQFLPCIVGNIAWRAAVTTTRLSKLANVTDEILMLFLLENNWKVWEATYHNKMLDEESQKIEVPRALYTEFSGKTARKYSGWNAAGMDRWNAFWNMIRTKRRIDQELMNMYEEKVKEGVLDPTEQGPPSTFDSRYMEYAAVVWGGKVPNETGGGDDAVVMNHGPRIMHGYHDDEDWENLQNTREGLREEGTLMREL